MDQETPKPPVVHDACGLGGKKRLLGTVQDCPWKFVSLQILDCKGQEIMYPVETTGIGGTHLAGYYGELILCQRELVPSTCCADGWGYCCSGSKVVYYFWSPLQCNSQK